ncbi:Nramp family divalent metal transporter [Algoriphagus halophytocola]|uniref:Nramp family divalent metal transporter n=1 Tax=Algoriphagus halophytocola TaxID=2991499 RepID=A0ABY6MJE4_9BACT|nr:MULTISPECIES: Nramp family divalent metal transporter [unclassified Algoriphagus]UZD23763.1 Nramp family divalent metal transporter [Algoriphagus sp. TR-M5]WBL45057.1 Nramp family divalent metal transporter [Algoriphagus sp. TR-M9]
MPSPFKNIGPGPLIAAAFIGPGTVTVCTLAGVNFGYALLWALVLSIGATVILQEITGRIGLVTGQDLSQLIREQDGNPVFRYVAMSLVLLAIGLGNAAYESGNISGTNLGLQVFWEAPIFQTGSLEFHLGNLILGFLAFGMLWLGSYQKLERVLVALVIFMSLAFVLTAFLTQPDWNSLLGGLIPSPDSGQFTTIVALIGTTVVPYNLFLYASLAKNKWSGPKDIPWMRRDIAISIMLGGLVSMAILSVGASSESDSISNALDVSRGLESVFGSFAKYMMGFGLLAAGLTSSITAPLAAGLVICGILGKSQDIRSKAMRLAMGSIVGLGIIFSSLGLKPVQLITLAQLANGVLLPLISGWIIWIAAKPSVLGRYRNRLWQSLLAALIWLITLALGLKSILTVLGNF